MPVLHLASAPHFSMFHSGPLLVTVWSGAATDAIFDSLDAAQTAYSKRFPNYYIASIVAEIDASGSGNECAKRRGLPLTKKFEAHSIGTATVILPGGVVGGVARSFVAAFNLMNPSKAPTRVFGDVRSTVEWFASLNGVPFGSTEAAIAEITAELPAKTTKIKTISR